MFRIQWYGLQASQIVHECYFYELNFSPKTGTIYTNLSITIKNFGLCKLPSSFQYLNI